MRQTTDYVALVTPQHQIAPRFLATVAASVDPLASLQSFLLALELAFDFDTAIGAQLDAVGVRVGRSRGVPTPLPGIYFSVGLANRGVGQAPIKGPYSTRVGIYLLDDETFRRLIRAKVLANRWDGTVPGQEAIYGAYFIDPATLVFVSDDGTSNLPEGYFSVGDPLRGVGQGRIAPAGSPSAPTNLPPCDMVMTVGIAGKTPTLIDLAILQQGLVGAKPEGVTVQYQVASVSGAPVFGLGLNNAFVGGVGHGAIGATPAHMIARLSS